MYNHYEREAASVGFSSEGTWACKTIRPRPNCNAPTWLQIGCSKRLEVRPFDKIYKQTIESSKWSQRLPTLLGSRAFHKSVWKIIFISKALICNLEVQRTLNKCFHCHHQQRTEPWWGIFRPMTSPVCRLTSAPVWLTCSPRYLTKSSLERWSNCLQPQYASHRVMGTWTRGWALAPGARPKRKQIWLGLIRGIKSYEYPRRLICFALPQRLTYKEKYVQGQIQVISLFLKSQGP